MDLSIIVVNYQSKDKLKNCLQSLLLVDFGEIKHEVIIVENNSGDRLEEMLSDFPDVKLVVSGKNLGMGGGNNLGIKNSSGRLILIANPDLIFSRDSVKKLVECLDGDGKMGVVGPRLLNPDGSLQYSCARFPRWYMPILRRTFVGWFFPGLVDDFLMKNFDHRKSQAVDWLLGACLLVRRNDFQDETVFDERFFMYCEDIDLCRRVKKRGQAVYYCAASEVTHDHVRASAKYPWYLALFRDPLARIHLASWVTYFKKWPR